MLNLMVAEKLFTVEQVAKIFQVSERTIFRWIENGDVFQRVVRIGNKRKVLRIPAEEIERLGVKVSYDESDND